jgi:hypothetical protein
MYSVGQKAYDYALEQADLARSTQIEAYWIAAGFGLQGYYTGVERVFEHIAQVVDGSLLRQSERWHQGLLDQMRIEVPGIRPTVIRDSTYHLLRQSPGGGMARQRWVMRCSCSRSAGAGGFLDVLLVKGCGSANGTG